MKPIETEYRGYRFRSRLEARWAVFFNELNSGPCCGQGRVLQWEYEPQGFVLSDGTHYLPDFKLTSFDGEICWIEVKPKEVTVDHKFKRFQKDLADDFERKIRHADYVRSESALLFSGDPVDVLNWMHARDLWFCPRCALPIAHDADIGEHVYCDACDAHTPCGGDHSMEAGVLAFCSPHKGHLLVTYWDRYIDHLFWSANGARGARFEHGDHGGIRCA